MSLATKICEQKQIEQLIFFLCPFVFATENLFCLLLCIKAWQQSSRQQFYVGNKNLRFFQL